MFLKNDLLMCQKRHDGWQTVRTQIRRRVLRRLNWVYTVCSGLAIPIDRLFYAYLLSVFCSRRTTCEFWQRFSDKGSRTGRMKGCFLDACTFILCSCSGILNCKIVHVTINKQFNIAPCTYMPQGAYANSEGPGRPAHPE